jgi:hypothetical protein
LGPGPGGGGEFAGLTFVVVLVGILVGYCLAALPAVFAAFEEVPPMLSVPLFYKVEESNIGMLVDEVELESFEESSFPLPSSIEHR